LVRCDTCRDSLPAANTCDVGLLCGCSAVNLSEGDKYQLLGWCVGAAFNPKLVWHKQTAVRESPAHPKQRQQMSPDALSRTCICCACASPRWLVTAALRVLQESSRSLCAHFTAAAVVMVVPLAVFNQQTTCLLHLAHIIFRVFEGQMCAVVDLHVGCGLLSLCAPTMFTYLVAELNLRRCDSKI
jgi:hypothetical protein